MSRVLIGTVPIRGHVGPFVAVARMLRDCGHEVAWYTGAKYADMVRESGVTHLGYREAVDFDDADFDATFPQRAALSGLSQLRYDMKHVFIDGAAGQLRDLTDYAREFRPDLLLSDPGMIGAALLSEQSGIPSGVLGILPLVCSSADIAPFGLGLAPGHGALARVRNRVLNWLVQHIVFGDVQRHWLDLRRQLGMTPTEWWMDAGVRRVKFWVQPTVPGFEYPRSDLPSTVQFAGLLTGMSKHPPPLPDYLDEMRSRPIVHVTQGTLANTDPRLIKPTLEALADEAVWVVVSTGGRDVAELGLGPLPANARVSTFLDYERFLPRVAVMVTNGGYGGVQQALKHGVPLVVAGATEDKPEVAARVAWSGTGINLRTETPTPKQVRQAVRQILSDKQYSASAARLAREYAGYDALATVRALVERWAGAAGTARVPSSAASFGAIEAASI